MKNYRIFIQFGFLGFALLPVPVLWLVSHDPPRFALLGQLLFAALFSIFQALIGVLATIAFPTSVRYTGLALSGNLTVLLGGAFPMIGTLLVKLTHMAYLPGFYVSLVALLAFIAILISRPMQAFKEF